MIDYIFRNHKTGMEIKKVAKKELELLGNKLNAFGIELAYNVPRGFKLHQIVNYGVSTKERKAK